MNFCDIWESEKDFGYLLNYETGKVRIGGSTSGALIPGALCLASQFFKDERMAKVAKESGEYYRTHDLAWGVTTGGPGDAVQSPDGESIFGLIESFIILFEMTGENVWCQAACHACFQAASWVISYPYEFPQNSALNQIKCDASQKILSSNYAAKLPQVTIPAGGSVLFNEIW